MTRIFLITGILLLSFIGFSQQIKNDSVYELQAIEITSSRIETFSSGQKLLKIDSLTTSLYKAGNLGQLLAKNTSVQIRSYGGISSISFRGTASHHTGVFWNGFAVNPSNIGMTNLATIQTGYFNEVKLLYGGGSSLYGSGNIGGSIHLGSKPKFNSGNSGRVSITLGSFNEYDISTSAKFSSQNWFSNTSILLKSAKNDFPYETLKGEADQMKNNKTEQYGILQDIYHKFKSSTLGGSFWYQNNYKEIPSSLTEKANDAYQEDESFKTVVSWNKYLNRAKLSINGSFFYDDLHYLDPAENNMNIIDSQIKTSKTSVESVFTMRLVKNSDFKTGMIFINDQGKSDNWNGGVLRRQLGLFAYWLQKFPGINWSLDVKLRQDFTEGYKVPFTPAIGAEGRVYRNLSAKFNVSRNFRVPTFNDLFWVGLGNEDLQPESSWNEEAGIIYKNNMRGRIMRGQIELTTFSSQVDDWILWVPEGLVFRPENIQKVWSRGLELEGNVDLNFGPVLFGLNGGYTYSRSTNEKSQGEGDATYQKQLIYIPKNRFFINTNVSYKKFVISYNQNFTGKQYVTSDNLESLPAYSVGNISMQKTFLVGKHGLTAQFEILNIWDVTYQTNQYYPMPGRSFKFSFVYSIN